MNNNKNNFLAEAQRRQGKTTIKEWANKHLLEVKNDDRAHGIISRETTESGNMIIFVSEDYARKYMKKFEILLQEEGW